MKTVAEVASMLEKELQIEVSESKIRRWESEGILTVKRNENDARIFNDKDIIKLKTALILSELGIPFETIKEYYKNPLKAEFLVNIFQRTAILKNFINWAEENIGKMTFDSI